MQETGLSLHRSCSPVPSTMAEVVGRRAARGTIETNIMGSGRMANVGLHLVRAHQPLVELEASDASQNAMNVDGENKIGKQRYKNDTKW